MGCARWSAQEAEAAPALAQSKPKARKGKGTTPAPEAEAEGGAAAAAAAATEKKKKKLSQKLVRLMHDEDVVMVKHLLQAYPQGAEPLTPVSLVSGSPA
jgi:hypothetical protein